MKFKRKSPSVVQSDVESGLALLDPTSNTYFLLNRTGSAVWEELKKPKSLEEVCEIVSGKFSVEPADCERDVKKFIESMIAKGLVVVEYETTA